MMMNYSKTVIKEMIEFMRSSGGMNNSPCIPKLEAELVRRKKEDIVEVYGVRKTEYTRENGYLTEYLTTPEGIRVYPTAQTPEIVETGGMGRCILMPRSQAKELGIKSSGPG